MSLAIGEAVAVGSGAWTQVATVTGNGTKQTIGFSVSCEDATIPFQVRLESPGGTRLIPLTQCLAGQACVVYDAPYTIPNSTACNLMVQHSAGSSKNFDGAILGS